MYTAKNKNNNSQPTANTNNISSSVFTEGNTDNLMNTLKSPLAAAATEIETLAKAAGYKCSITPVKITGALAKGIQLVVGNTITIIGVLDGAHKQLEHLTGDIKKDKMVIPSFFDQREEYKTYIAATGLEELPSLTIESAEDIFEAVQKAYGSAVVEIANEHGFFKRLSKGDIEVAATLANGQMGVEVSNNGAHVNPMAGSSDSGLECKGSVDLVTVTNGFFYPVVKIVEHNSSTVLEAMFQIATVTKLCQNPVELMHAMDGDILGIARANGITLPKNLKGAELKLDAVKQFVKPLASIQIQVKKGGMNNFIDNFLLNIASGDRASAQNLIDMLHNTIGFQADFNVSNIFGTTFTRPVGDGSNGKNLNNVTTLDMLDAPTSEAWRMYKSFSYGDYVASIQKVGVSGKVTDISIDIAFKDAFLQELKRAFESSGLQASMHGEYNSTTLNLDDSCFYNPNSSSAQTTQNGTWM